MRCWSSTGLAAILAFVSTLAGCGGSGGGGTSSARLALDTASAQSGPTLPWDQFFLNERVIFRFSADIDPATVTPDTIQIRSRSTGLTTSAGGDFVVNGNVVSFVPTLASRADLSDAGLVLSTVYRIFIPGFPSSNTIRSLRGDAFPADFTVDFRTRETEPLLLDPVAGAPRVTAIALDLNGDGIFEADGDPLTPEPEEFLNLNDPVILTNAPVGLARAPLRIAFLVNEPLLPSTVFRDFDDNGLFDNVQLINSDRNVEIPHRLLLDQRFIPEEDRFLTRLIVEPRSTLPAGTNVSVRLFGGITDSANPPFQLPSMTAAIVTMAGPASFSDALIEGFDTRENAIPSNSAEWDSGNSNFLAAGAGLGGTGVDGPLRVMSGTSTSFNTRDNEGFFNFTSIIVEDNAVLIIEGPNPFRLFATGDVQIDGSIRADGQSGGAGTIRGGGVVIAGGTGGPGGGDGGNANDPPLVSLVENNMQFALDGGSPVPDGGGEGGRTTSTGNTGGGAGGGHSIAGRNVVGANPSQGGIEYGDPMIIELLAGSGGGGGGDSSQGNAFPPVDESTGGGGGGGGGAILINTQGQFSITGSISVDGGNGGAGGLRRGNQVDGGGGGGSGSGGAILIQALSVAPIIDSNASISAVMGIFGMSGGGGSRSGAAGAPGRIRLEVFDSNRNGVLDASELMFNGDTAEIVPDPSLGLLDEDPLGITTAESVFFDTGTKNARYQFDGSDPATGAAVVDVGVEDFLIPGGIPSNATVTVFFEGADEDPDNRRKPDLSTLTGFLTNIEDLNGFQFIRFRIVFDIGSDIQTAPRPRVERFRIRFDFDI